MQSYASSIRLTVVALFTKKRHLGPKVLGSTFSHALLIPCMNCRLNRTMRIISIQQHYELIVIKLPYRTCF